MWLYASPENGTWSIVMIRINGFACLVVVGKDFEPIAPVNAGSGNAHNIVCPAMILNNILKNVRENTNNFIRILSY